MKLTPLRRCLSAIAVLLVFHTSAMAASADEISDIRNQLRALSERVDRLERENESLKAQNAALQAKDESKSESKSGSAQPAEQASDAKAASWTERVELSSDLRYRHELTSDDTLN
ncbi:MAG TPA: hypothetical protein VFS24_12665 [Steroidobacteraceae bacterium]|nr:hypothetical protein [Steroidobacteraceae bacterium]